MNKGPLQIPATRFRIAFVVMDGMVHNVSGDGGRSRTVAIDPDTIANP